MSRFIISPSGGIRQEVKIPYHHTIIIFRNPSRWEASTSLTS